MIIDSVCCESRNALSFIDSYGTSNMKLSCLRWKKAANPSPPETEDMRPPSPFATTVNEIRRLSVHGHEQLMACEQERREMIEATKRLVHLVQTPEEAVRNNAFSV